MRRPLWKAGGGLVKREALPASIQPVPAFLLLFQGAWHCWLGHTQRCLTVCPAPPPAMAGAALAALSHSPAFPGQHWPPQLHPALPSGGARLGR